MNKDALLVTGASSDIGLALIRRVASTRKNFLILAHYHSGRERIEELSKQLGSDSILPLHCDFSSEASTVELAEKISRDFGAPSQMVHLPGVKLVYERFTKFNWEHFQTDLNIQLRSAVILLKRLLPAMAKLPKSKVVFVLSSVTRGVPPKYLSMYGIVKQAQLGLMRALASEYDKSGPAINAVTPGMVETRFLDNVPELVRQKAAADSPRGRNARPEDVVHAIEFLLSSECDYVNGIELPVTGGVTY
jgi:3-oxoacyl-[acyl-carrier protein] reductase